jgi:endonuclease I
MMKPVQEVFSEQNPDPELMHMKHLVPRFETIHASRCWSGKPVSMSFMRQVELATSVQSDVHNSISPGLVCAKSVLLAVFAVVESIPR